MKKYLIAAISSLLFAIEEPTIAESNIEEQKVHLCLDDIDTYRRAIRPPSYFAIVYAVFRHKTMQLFIDDGEFGCRCVVGSTKELFLLTCKTFIKYHEKSGAFDNIRDIKSITDYPLHVRDNAEEIEVYMRETHDKSIRDEGFKLVEREYGKELTLKLKAFINHIVELVKKEPEEPSDYLYIPEKNNDPDYYEQLEDYVKSLGEVLPLMDQQERIKRELEMISLCTDMEHFSTRTLQDIALMLFFYDQIMLSEPEPRRDYALNDRPMTKEACRLAYKPLKGKSVGELVHIIYDALESKRVILMYVKPDDTTPFFQALYEKYEKMNYRELAQWVHDEVEQIYR